MLRRFALIFVVSGFSSLAVAQDDIQQIKQQINQLQQMLDSMENAPAPKRNVTQIGASKKNRKQDTGMLIKIYDLGDLFAVAPPYPAHLSSDLNPGTRLSIFESTVFSTTGATTGMGGMGGMGGGFFSVGPNRAALNSVTAASTAATSSAAQAGTTGSVKGAQDELIQVIRETISPDLWKEGGKITKMGNAFVISADEDAHQQIEMLLNLFRSRWGTLRTVSVRAWWFSLSPADLRGILNAGTEKITPEGPPIFGIVRDEAWNSLMKIWEQPAENDVHRLRYQATLTCYNGQTVSTQSGTQDLAVSSIEAIVPRNENEDAVASTGYQPSVTPIQQGLVFQMTPITNISGKTVLLDIHSRLTLPAGIEDVQPGHKKSGKVVFPEDVVRPIDRRRLNIHRLSTTARVPVDRPYLIGGMSMPGAETEGLQLYLFVKISVQELRNDQESAGKGLDETPAGKEQPAHDQKPAEKKHE